MEIQNYDVIGCPLVFPKLCCKLIQQGISLRVVGKMGGDYQLNGYLTRYFIDPDKDLDVIPDVVYYVKGTGQWCEIFNSDIWLDWGKQGKFRYSWNLTKLIEEQSTLNVLLDYLRLNSSASIECLGSTVAQGVC